MTESGRLRRRRARTGIVLLLSTTLAVTTLSAEAWAVPAPGMTREQLELPDIPQSDPITPDDTAETSLTTADEVPVTPYQPVAVTPWQQDSGAVDLTGAEPGTSKPVDDLPIALGVPEGGDPEAVAGTWAVDLAAPETSQTAGVPGLVMKVTPPATVDPGAEVALSVDYTAFADLYGPQAADRFGLMLLPDCVYDAPDSGDCATEGGTQTMAAAPDGDGFDKVPSQVEVVPAAEAPTRTTAAKGAEKRRVVSGTVSVGWLLKDRAAAGAKAEVEADTDAEAKAGTEVKADTGSEGHSAQTGSVRTALATAGSTSTGSGVVGALDTGASASGDYTATPLLSSGSWAAGSSSGAFTYGYQVQTPETAGGVMPKVNLSYSSQSVDGRTSASNNQASWIGDGWDYNAGVITRTYAGCTQDSKKPGANNATHRTGDMCWGSDNATLSLGGMTTELVRDDTKNTWTTANGDGSKVQLLKNTGLGNGDADGEYWVVTTRDGTKYYFGRHKLPGWTTGDPVTNSVLTVPVYGNHAGEPCYKAGDWPGSHCTQAWRWGLDYVEDIQGNAMSLWWARETNYYARNFNFKAPVSYHRGGYLTHIDYGQREDTLFSAAPLARIAFDVKERCFTEGSLTCSEANFTDKDPGKYRIWYDTPADLRCESGKKCWNAAPSFWTRKRLDKITTLTQRVRGSSTLHPVDTYQLTQSFPVLKTGPNTALWLESITRTGHGTDGRTVTLNPVRFESNTEDMPNRVMRGSSDPRPGFSRLRIARVISEYGGETVVTYKQPTGECATGTGLPGKSDTAALKSNARLCYPSYWHPDPSKEDIDWFHKYVVENVEELPNVDGAYATQTAYTYKNAAWKLAEQEFTKKSTRTYSRFAGFEQVTVITGADDPLIGSKKTKAVTRYFRGMGDTVPVHDITGAEIAKDNDPFAGRIAEELTYANASDADTAWITRSVTFPEAKELAKRVRGDGLSDLRAWRVTEPRQVSYTKSSTLGDDKRTERVVETRTAFGASYGLPTQIEFRGDTGKSGDESCTKLEYLHEHVRNIIGLTKQTLTSATSCAAADFSDLTKLTSATRTAYDGQAYGAALTSTSRGLASQSWSLKADKSGFQNEGTTEFDAIGRVVKATDPDLKSSTIAYDPPTGQAYKVVQRNSLGHEQSSELDPGRGTAHRTTDTNGHTSQAVFDPLGRLVEAWGPGRTPSSSAVPDFRAAYTIPENDPGQDRKPPYVTTYMRGHENRVETAVTLYDGLGRERQSQETATGGGRLITDTLYNSSGEVWQTNNAYFAEGKPSGELFTPLADTAVPNATRYTYDGLGRVLEEMPVLNGTETPGRATRYEYGPDHSTVVNPAGASSYRVFTDALGRTMRVDTFTDPTRTVAPITMRYTYDSKGQLEKVTHSADPTRPWTWTYDGRGRMETATDPDSGTTRTTYDHRDRPVTVTNARGVTVWTGYDELSRPKQQRLGGASGTLLSDYTYDTAPGGKGLPAASTRYTDGEPYRMTVGGYTDSYQPVSTTLSLPQSLADTWDLKTSYTYSYEYTDTGLLQSAQLPAVGGLGSEKLVARYNSEGMPLSLSGKDWYGSEVVYSPYGQIQRATLGAQPNRVWTQANYDEASGALQDQMVYREQTGHQSVVANNLVSHRSYWYDNAGNVTSIRERATGIEERQCFRHDPLGQLTEAWTSGDQASCAAGPIKADGSANVTAGPDHSGYWQQYEYDLLGNRKSLVQKDLTGDTAKDATTTYTYGKADGSQPRTLTKVRKEYVTPAGAQITTEAERLYELTGDMKSVTSVQNGDKQELTWTYDGQIETITGQGSNGRTPYVGLAGKCLDLKAGTVAEGQPIQLYSCNSTLAQKWSFKPTPGGTDANVGTLTSTNDDWCVQPVSGAAGAAIQLQKCDGSSAQQLTRTAAGQLKHNASGLCLASKDASSNNSTPIVLVSCNMVDTSQLWEAQNQTRHIYGPDGARLLTIQGRQATLHLGEAEVTTQKNGVLVNTQRTYAAPGGAVLRYANNTGSSQLVAMAGDHQGSPYAEVSLNSQMQVRVRKQDPFGNERSGATSGMNPQSHAGFLGQTRDDASGYQPLGARLYDPVVGRFISADPILDLADPLQSNGYAYAHNNPVTLSDPTGLAVKLTGSERAAALAGVGLSASEMANAEADLGRTVKSVILATAWDVLNEFIPIDSAIACFGGSLWGCADTITSLIPPLKLFKLIDVGMAALRTAKAIKALYAAQAKARETLSRAKAALQKALDAKKAAIEKAKKAAQAAKKKAADKVKTTSNKAVNAIKKTGNRVQKQAQAKAAPRSSSAASSGVGRGGGSRGGDKPGGSSGGSSRSNGGSSGGSGAGKADEPSGGGACPINRDNSFTPSTKVLMADGTTKPIENVKTGDKVLATDPRTGETRVETVTAEIKGQGLKHLVKVTIDTDGKNGSKTAEVTATDGHPFWVPELGEWIDATNLKSGQWLQTSAGTYVQITAVERWTTQNATVHNLTVSDLHTYYVLAGATPVLVHNCNGVSIYRTPKVDDMAHELERGPNPASHQDGDASVYLGEKSVAKEYQNRGSYANGSIRYDMHEDFLKEFSDTAFRYDRKGPGGSARIEFVIPVGRLDRFNELTLRRVWEPGNG
ncbi:ricin-type beta-trefoil lectin domain protein [Streptomyces sp. MUM 203J]|uniref:ricin-type beta-trefoil lectin domain protein n=1 Tax=Streptomyces sp. MUM 203J TaxID=2791990 RepID=UPI001F04FB4B|nr:ricin-type beta-trefoil lectin domain protein [Streptomyces sp. MUM 203J]